MTAINRMMVALTVVGLFVVADAAWAADWPHWRGPNYDGISQEKDLRDTWGDEGPRILWEREIGPAYSSLVCAGGRVFTCGTQGDRQVLFCLDAEKGEEIWKKPFEDGYDDGQGAGTRSTPTIDDGRVFILGALGTLVCVDAKTGEQLWTRKFEGKPKWGYSGSVLIQGDLAILSPGESAGGLCALNKKSGEVVWKCGDDVAGYATPYPFEFNGQSYVCGFLGRSVIIAELKTGKPAWSTPWKTDYNVNAATPIFHDGYLFLSSGYETGCALFKLGADGGKLSAKEVWRSKVLKNKFQTPVLLEGKLYGCDQSSLSCVDFMTGKRQWRERRVKHGTVLAAGGRIVLLTEKGDLRIAQANPKEFKPSAEARVLDGRCWTAPILSDGRLYARNMEKVICVDLRK